MSYIDLAEVFIARMHQCHDEKIGQELAASALGDQYQCFEHFLEIGGTGITHDLRDGGSQVLGYNEGPNE